MAVDGGQVRRRRRRGQPAVAAAVLMAVCGCSGTSDNASTPTASTPTTVSSASSTVAVAPGSVPAPAHVVVVVFENKDAESVIGSSSAPYLTSLAQAGADFTDAHAETHPSQPNYIALFSGSTQGVTDDSCPAELSGDNLAAQLLDAGKTFVGYSEDLPHEGAPGPAAPAAPAGHYGRKPNPWVDFADLPAETTQPYSALPADFADLPTVAFVVPDMC